MPIKLGTVGHFGISVRDPEKSAHWWVKNLNVKKLFSFPDGVLIGTDAVTIVLLKGEPRPEVLDHVSFHLNDMKALRDALAELKRKGVELEDPGEEIGPEASGSKNMGLWFHDPDGYRWELSVLAKRPVKRPVKRKAKRTTKRSR
ncbi:MAG TPA: VOC family protein [Candidatus Eremiobacteraceae bacterium]|nr:VOC family protein [Candidatus Eremiobacteraceae bacterium]